MNGPSYFGVFALGVALLGGCTNTAPPDRLVEVDATLRELGLPTVESRVASPDSVWRVFVDSSSAAWQLVVVNRIAALMLPDGDFELLKPLTYFRYQNDVWRQATQSAGGTIIPPMAERELATELSDRERTYFFRVRTMPLDAGALSTGTSAKMRSLVELMTREAATLRTSGFIGADAEP